MGVCYRLYADLFGYVTDHVVVNRAIFSEQNFLYKHHAHGALSVFCTNIHHVVNQD